MSLTNANVTDLELLNNMQNNLSETTNEKIQVAGMEPKLTVPLPKEEEDAIDQEEEETRASRLKAAFSPEIVDAYEIDAEEPARFEVPIVGLGEPQERILQAATGTDDPDALLDYKEEIAPISNTYARVFGRTFIEDAQKTIPWFNNLLLKSTARAASLQWLPRLANSIYNTGYNAVLSGLDYAVPSLRFDEYYRDDSSIMSGNDPWWIDKYVSSDIDSATKWMDKHLKTYGNMLLDLMPPVPIEERNDIHHVVHKSAILSSPMAPFLRALHFASTTPKALKTLSDAGNTMGTAVKKRSKEYVSDSINYTLGTAKAAIGGAVAWQAAETVLEGSKYQELSPFFAIFGAMYGGDRMAKIPVRYILGTSLYALTKSHKKFGIGINPDFGTREGVGSSGHRLGLAALAIMSDVPYSDIAKRYNDPQALRDLINISSVKHLNYMDKLAKGYENLPEPYREIVGKALSRFDTIVNNMGEKGIHLIGTLGQVVGLAAVDGLARAQIHEHKAGLFKGIDEIIVKSNIEDQQQIVQKQIDATSEALIKEMNKNDLFVKDQTLASIRKNAEGILDTARKNAKEYKDVVDDMSTRSKTFFNTRDMTFLRNLADKPIKEGGFGWDEAFGSTQKTSLLSQNEIYRKQTEHLDEVENHLTSNFNYAKKIIGDSYDLIKQNSIPVDATLLTRSVTDIREDFIVPALQSLSKEGRTINSKTSFVSFLRQNTLNAMTTKELEGVLSDLMSARQQGFGYQGPNSKGILQVINWDNIKKQENAMKEQGVPDSERANFLRKIIARATGTDEKSAAYMDTLVAPTVEISDLIKFRSELLGAYRKTRGNAEGEAIHNLETNLTNYIDETFKNLDEAGMKVTKSDGTQISYEEAYKNAREQYIKYGLPWKSMIGTSSKETMFRSINEETLGLEHTMALFLQTTSPKQGAELFKTMFQDPKSIEQSSKLIQLTIGRILAGDLPNLKDKFINNLTHTGLAEYRKAKMITRFQEESLIRLVDKRTQVHEALNSESIKANHDRVINEIVPDFKREIDTVLGKESELAKKVQGVDTPSKFFRLLVEESQVKIPRMTKKEVQPFVDDFKKGAYRGKEVLDEFGFPQSMPGFKNNVDDLDMDSFSNQFVDTIVNNTKFTNKQKIDKLDDVEKMMMYMMYKDSFKLTTQKNPAKSAHYQFNMKGRTEPLSMEEVYSKYKETGLMKDIDFTRYAELLEQTFPVFKKIAESKHVLGDNKVSERFQNLTEIFEVMRMSLAQTANVTISDVGRGISMASGLSRVWAVARGVVSLRFIASEAFIRVQHQRKNQYITEILTNPETVKIIHDVAVRGKRPTVKQIRLWKKIAVQAFGEHAHDKMSDGEFGDWIQYCLTHYDPRDRTSAGFPADSPTSGDRKVVTDSEPRLIVE